MERKTLLDARRHSPEAYQFELKKISFKKLTYTCNSSRTLKRIQKAITMLLK